MDDTGLLPIEQHICFALYSASRSLTGRYRELLAPLRITYPQYLVLLVLWEIGTGSVRQLGDRLQLDSGTLSPLLRRLETLGLVARSRFTADERVVTVSLTEAGDRMRVHARGISEQICASTGLADEELRELQREIEALATRVRALTTA